MTSFPTLRHLPLTTSLTDTFETLCHDDFIRRFLFDGERLSRAEVEAEVAESVRRGALGLTVLFEGDEPIGFCGFRDYPLMTLEPQLIYALREPWTGRGIATAAASSLLERARAHGWDRVVAATDRPNIASAAVLRRLGFEPAGQVPGVFGAIDLYANPLTEKGKSNLDEVRRPRPPLALPVTRTWSDEPARPDEQVALTLTFAPDAWIVEIDAPLHGDPLPTAPPGPTARLWEHEVVELFVLGEGQRYLEIELGPAGHHLVLALQGCRNVVAEGFELLYEPTARDGRWRGRAHIPLVWLPPRPDRINAYAIHGQGAERRYLAWSPTGGDRPDFHRLEHFGRLPR